MKSIAIDMDNVIVDIEGQYIDWYRQKFGVAVSREQLLGVPETEGFPNKEAVRQFLYTPGFFRTAKPLPGALEAVQILMQKFQVYIVSAAMEFPKSLPEKLEWLQEHLPTLSWRHIVFCGDKRIVGTDFMIDDHVNNLDTFSGKGLLFTACHNVNIDRHTRLNNWSEVLHWFEKEAAPEQKVGTLPLTGTFPNPHA
jgi:5'(3')-deoxyribonucleotidase